MLLVVSAFAAAGSCVIADANLRVLSQNAVGKSEGRHNRHVLARFRIANAFYRGWRSVDEPTVESSVVKPVAMTVISISPVFILSSTSAPKMMFASGSTFS